MKWIFGLFQRKPAANPALNSNSAPESIALARCDEQIDWYSKSSRRMRWSYYWTQIALIVLTGATPIVVLASKQPFIVSSLKLWARILRSPLLAAGLPAVATIIISITGLFQWHKKWLIRSSTAEILKSERMKFLIRAGNYSPSKSADENARLFVATIEQISYDELNEWKRLHGQDEKR